MIAPDSIYVDFLIAELIGALNSADQLTALDYASSSDYENGFILFQFYAGSRCNGTLTYNYGYRNGACLPEGTGSVRYYFQNSKLAVVNIFRALDDCTQTRAITYL